MKSEIENPILTLICQTKTFEITISSLNFQVQISSLKIMSETNDTQIADENTPLIQPSEAPKSFFQRHRRCSIFCLTAFLVILAIGLTIYFGYYHGIVTLKVFAFNVWGMPGGLGGCKYKKERMAALANVIHSRVPYFDILLMEELWMEADHSTLANASKAAGFYMTEFRELASRYNS